MIKPITGIISTISQAQVAAMSRFSRKTVTRAATSLMITITKSAHLIRSHVKPITNTPKRYEYLYFNVVDPENQEIHFTDQKKRLENFFQSLFTAIQMLGLALAHGLPNGWSALTFNVLPTTGLVAKYGRRTMRAVSTPVLA
ncbi:hypothetical protein LFLT20_00200 [Limosilactobacillus fermentum]|nr:hypothetical protein ikematsu_05170 [Limosilactobacillus fermentum]GIC73016.1 hypothetical protein LFLT20_00200 [Limosilactobacillus fermentum]